MSRFTENMVAEYGEYVRVKKAASLLGVGRSAVYRMRLDGRLRYVGEGRYQRVSVESIAAYIESHTHEVLDTHTDAYKKYVPIR